MLVAAITLILFSALCVGKGGVEQQQQQHQQPHRVAKKETIIYDEELNICQGKLSRLSVPILVLVHSSYSSSSSSSSSGNRYTYVRCCSVAQDANDCDVM